MLCLIFTDIGNLLANSFVAGYLFRIGAVFCWNPVFMYFEGVYNSCRLLKKILEDSSLYTEAPFEPKMLKRASHFFPIRYSLRTKSFLIRYLSFFFTLETSYLKFHNLFPKITSIGKGKYHKLR